MEPDPREKIKTALTAVLGLLTALVVGGGLVFAVMWAASRS